MRASTVADGDLNADLVPPDLLDARWRALTGRTVTWLDEVHGTTVVVVDRPGAHRGAEADAAVTSVPGPALGIWVGDCAPVALVGERGVVAVAHAGWRGLIAGVLERTVATARAQGSGALTAVLGPCIGPECYEFGDGDLDAVVAATGPTARGRTSWGAPALDVRAAVAAVLAREGVPLDASLASCTACTPGFWSHRARGDLGRHGLAVWLEGTP